jgi:hypothetical protein
MSDFFAETRMCIDGRARSSAVVWESIQSSVVVCRRRMSKTGGEHMVAKPGWIEELVAGAVRAELERALGRRGGQPVQGEIDKALAELVRRIAAPVQDQADRLAKATADRVIGTLLDGLGGLKRK